MIENEFRLKEVTDFELLTKAIFYLHTLRFTLPHGYLYDACSGAIVLLFDLRKRIKSVK